MTVNATNNGKVNPRLLVVVRVGHAQPRQGSRVHDQPTSAAVSSRQASHWRCLEGATLVTLWQHHVLIYLSFVFALELTKLLSNLNLCLEDHFNGIELVARCDDDVGERPRELHCGLADVL